MSAERILSLTESWWTSSISQTNVSRSALLTLLAHSVMTAYGFEYLGTQENETNQQPLTALASDWSSQLQFVYKHAQSKVPFMLKGIFVKNDADVKRDQVKLQFHVQGNEKSSISLILNDYFSEDSVSFKDLQECSELPSLIASICSQIENFVPRERIDNSLQNSFQNERMAPAPSSVRMGFPSLGVGIRPTPPWNVGHQDLDPLGSLSGPLPGGGMFMGPNHPIFQRPAPMQPFGDRWLPPGAVPPGARFDPISPIAPFGRPSRPPQQPPFGSGEPDNDEMPPPGYMDQFM